LIPKFSITGDKELDTILRGLGRDAIKDSEIKRALKKVAKPLIQDIRKNINNVTGNLGKSIGVIKKIKSRKGRPFILVGPRYYGNFNGYHAHLVEVGKQNYDVSFDEQHNIKRAFEKNKTKALNEVNQHLITMLNKKLNKLK